MKFAFTVGTIEDQTHNDCRWLEAHPNGYKFPPDFDFESVWSEIIDGYDGSFIWRNQMGEMDTIDYDLVLKTMELLGEEKFEYKFNTLKCTHWKAAPTEKAYVYLVVDVDAEKFFPAVFKAQEIISNLTLRVVAGQVDDCVTIGLG